MTHIDSSIVYSIYAVYNNSFVSYYVRGLNESEKYFAMTLYNKLKTENTKHFSIYSYGSRGYTILEYNNDGDEGETFWVVPEDDIYDFEFTWKED